MIYFTLLKNKYKLPVHVSRGYDGNILNGSILSDPGTKATLRAHETLNRCRVDVGQPSTMLFHHSTNAFFVLLIEMVILTNHTPKNWVSLSQANSLVGKTTRLIPANTKHLYNICITFVQCRPNVFDVGSTLYKCYTNVLCLLGWRAF